MNEILRKGREYLLLMVQVRYGIDRTRKIGSGDGFVANREAQIALDGEEERLVGSRLRFGCGDRQIDADIDRRERCGDHKNNEQHQHDVDEWRDIDFMEF